MNTTLYFLRHGKLEGDKEGILHGPSDSVSLSEAGREQILVAARRFKEEEISSLISSTETRTRESALIIQEQNTIPVQFDVNLVGRNWGSWAGREWTEVRAELEALTLEERYAFAPPGGESWKDFESRILSVLDSIILQYAGRKVCLISHGSVIRVLLPKVFNLSVEESLKYYPDYGSLSLVEHDGNGFIQPRLA